MAEHCDLPLYLAELHFPAEHGILFAANVTRLVLCSETKVVTNRQTVKAASHVTVVAPKAEWICMQKTGTVIEIRSQ
jgi:hypothetical protein